MEVMVVVVVVVCVVVVLRGGGRSMRQVCNCVWSTGPCGRRL